MSMQLTERVRELMENNRRETDGYQHTLPSPELYPFQWFWDSCFHAIILSHFDLDAAEAELRSVLSRPLPSGLIPHIIFWNETPDTATWGREMRGDVINSAWQTKGVSSITQPPVAAYAIWRVFEKNAKRGMLDDLYPVLRGHFACLHEDRTFNGDSLLYIINPDESGEDNSPRFDRAQALSPMHSADENLDKRIELIRQNATCNFEAKTCMSNFFGIADVPFNALYANDLAYLALIAEELDRNDEADMYRSRKLRVEREMREQLFVGDCLHAYDHIQKEHVDVLTWAIFTPLFSGLLSQDEAETLVSEYLLNLEHFKTPYMVPSTACSEPSYDPTDGFWRGPVWMVPNWFIYHGLKRYGFSAVANELQGATRALIEQSGFREQYHPETGAGLGAHDFTWGGLILDMDI